MLAPLGQEFFLALKLSRHPGARHEIQYRSLRRCLLGVQAVAGHRLHVAVFICRPHDIDVVIDDIVDEKGPDIARPIPRKHFTAPIFLPFAPVTGLPAPPTIAGIVKLRYPALILARLSRAKQKLFLDLVEGHFGPVPAASSGIKPTLDRLPMRSASCQSNSRNRSRTQSPCPVAKPEAIIQRAKRSVSVKL